MRLKYKWIITLFLALSMQFSFAQEKTVTGVVVDETGPIPGANVVVKGTNRSTQTDFEGKYAIKASAGEVLVFSFIGMKNITANVGTSSTVNIKMLQEDNTLEEVIVVGYGVQKKKDLTSSISSISGEAIKGLITPSFESQLAGRAAGVQVTTQNGILGVAPRVRIRGVATINSGTQPLYVVDGLPIYSGDIGGSADTNGLADINPNDIESFEVLKDGAATAIYGSRAANGVILITTKRGKKGTMKVSYSNVTGFASATKTFDLLKTADFLVINNEKRINAGQAAWAAGSNFDTDWQSEVLNKGAVQTDHSLSFSGGSDKTRYFMSLGYSTQDGIAKSNSLDRYSLRSNLEHEISSWLTAGANIGVTKTNTEGLNTGRNSISGNIFSAIRQLPNTSPFDATNPTGFNLNASGNIGQGTNLTQATDNLSNISYVLANNKFESEVTRIISSAFLSADILKGLNYRFQIGVDNASTNGFLYWNPLHGDGRGTNGRLSNNNNTLTRWNVQNVLSYNKTFSDDHNLSLTAVYEAQKEKNESFFATGTNITDPFFNQNVVTGAFGTQESGGGVNEEGIISYIGRASYNFKERYFVQGTIRRDGLSKFNSDIRYQSFPGVSGGWNIANESFMEDFKSVISQFKIRGSYSLTGNTNVGRSNYPYLSTYSPSFYGPNNGIAFTTFANRNLKWETSTKIDYGIDLALFNNRLTLNFDYFKNTSEDVVLQFPIDPSLGVPGNAIDRNAANVLNKGYEFGVDYRVINTKDFKWNVNANLTLQKNKVYNLPNNGADIIGGSSGDINIQPNIIIREGESLNSLYGFTYWGVNAANGNPVYYKADGSLVQGNIATANYKVFNPADPTNVSVASSLTQADKKIQGNSLPTYFGGFNSRMSYKDFDFSFLIRFSGGNKVFNGTRRDLLNLGLSNNSTEIRGRWQSITNPGDGVTPRLVANQNPFINQASNLTTRFVEDADFISLDNISLGYSFPKMLTEKISVEGVRLSAQVQNLFLITKYKGLDPELETSGVDLNGTPRARIFSIGINVNL
ncbi:SusC/RagA family TonB-linked outer membrane protein [Flavobacterium sp. GT2N3]|uniref:SusC/RagA family TonB-linked outer membrane protein n=1 Tax=unclassified Flavobacterium TaxID=196869 RepID=UPI003AB00EFD